MGNEYRNAIATGVLRKLLVGVVLGLLYLVLGPRVQTSQAQGIDVQPDAAGTWRTYQYNNARSGFNPAERTINSGTAANLALKWSVTLPNSPSISSQPILAGNRVYWGSWDGYARASDLNGSEVWHTFLGQTSVASPCWPPSAGVASTGTLANMRIGGASTVLFVGGGDARFYALNASNGKILWATRLGASPAHFIWGSPALENGSIYIGVSSYMDCPDVQGRLYKLNARTGQVQAVFKVVPDGCLGGGIWSSPAIDSAAGTVYVSTGNAVSCNVPETNTSALLELRLSDLKLLGVWTIPPAQRLGASEFGATPTLFRAQISGRSVNLVGLINHNGWYYALKRDVLKAGPVWSAQIARVNCPLCQDENISASAWDGKTLYIGSNDTMLNGTYCPGSLQAVDPASGKFKWQLCLPDGPVLAPVTAVPGLVAVTEGNHVLVVSSATGQTVFSYTGPGQFEGPAMIAKGKLFVGDMSGTFYAFGF